MGINIGPQIKVDGYSEYRKQINNVIQQSKTLAAEMKSVAAGFDKSDSAQKKAKATMQVLTQQVDTQRERVKLLSDMVKKASDAYGENDTRVLKWKEALNNATAELKTMEKQLKESKTQSNIFYREVEKLGNKLKDGAKNAIPNFGKALKTGLVAGAKAAVTSVAALTAAAGAAVVALGKIGLEYNMQMETYTTNFETMLGSSEAAAAKVEELKVMAAKTPFEMGDLADATQQLLAMGVQSEDTGKYLQQLGDISLGDANKLGSLVNAFGKMNSSGKVTLEYINIMSEQGFNPLNNIAKKTGETMEELYDRVSAGEVSFDEIKEAIEMATSAGGQFEGGMERASHTTEGMISTLKDNVNALIGEVFTPISNGLKNNILPGAIDAIDRLSAAFREDGLDGMISAAGEIIAETLGQFTEALPNFVDMAVGIVQSLLGGIRDNLDSITDGATETIITLVNGIGDMLPDIIVTGALLIGKLAAGLAKAIPDIARRIPEIIGAIVDGFAENWDDFVQIGKDIVNGIWGGIVALWDSLVSWFNSLWDNAFGKKTVDIQANTSTNTSRAIDGSHASGLSYVPFDGYLAQLHRGEMVLTRSQAEIMRKADSTVRTAGNPVNVGGVTFNVYQQPGESADALAERIMDMMQTSVSRKEAVFCA